MSVDVNVVLLLLLTSRAVSGELSCPECEDIFGDCLGCVLPRDPYLFIGSQLVFDCVLRNTNKYDASNLYFTWKNNERLPDDHVEVISNRQIRLNMTVTWESLTQVTFTCMANSSEGNDNIESSVLQLEWYPQEAENWTALIDDWKTLLVTWDFPHTWHNADDINVNVTWQATSANSREPCDNASDTHCFLTEDRYMNAYRYNITVAVTNLRTSNITITSWDLLSDMYVRPGKVDKLTPSSPNSTSLDLAWTFDPPSKKVFFRVNVTTDGDTSGDLKWTNITQGRNASVCRLRPYTNYGISVEVQATGGIYWSEARRVTAQTPQDKPTHGANLTTGSYLERPCAGGTRDITIYFKPPAEHHQNGELTRYRLTYAGSDGSRGQQNLSISLFSTERLLSCDVDYNISITTYTEVGESPPSVFRVWREGKVPSPRSVKVELSGSAVTVMWEMAVGQDPSSWLVLWCDGTRSTTTCHGNMDWLRVAGDQRSALLPLSSTNVTSIFMVAVAMAAQTASSGLTWQECMYRKDAKPDTKPFGIVIDEESPDRSLVVNWNMPVCQDEVLITHYILLHCEVGNTDSCKNLTTTSKLRSYAVKDLKAGINYSVQLKGRSISGVDGPYSDPVYGVPKYTGLTTGEIIGIGVGAAFVLVFIVAGFYACVRWSHRIMTEKYEVKMPSSFENLPSPPPLPSTHPPATPQEHRGVQQGEDTPRLSNGHVRPDRQHPTTDNGSVSGQVIPPETQSPSDQWIPSGSESVVDEVEQSSKDHGQAVKTRSNNTESYSKFATAHDQPSNVWEDSAGEGEQNEGFDSDPDDDYIISAMKPTKDMPTELNCEI